MFWSSTGAQRNQKFIVPMYVMGMLNSLCISKTDAKNWIAWSMERSFHRILRRQRLINGVLFFLSFSHVRLFFLFFSLFVLDLAIVCNSVVANLQFVTLNIVDIRRFFLKMSNIATLKKIAQCLNLNDFAKFRRSENMPYWHTNPHLHTESKLENYCWPKFECFA